MGRKRNYSTEELILMEFERYRISHKLQAIICLIKKMLDKNKRTNEIIRHIKESKNYKELEYIILYVLEQEEQLEEYMRDEIIDFRGQVIRELRLQAIKISEEKLKNIIITILMVDMDSKLIKSLYSEINKNSRTSENVQKIIAELIKDWKFESFLDMFVGQANLVQNIKSQHKESMLIGKDVNVNLLFFAIINLYINDEEKWKIECKNSISEFDPHQKVDLVVTEMPLLERINTWEINEKDFKYGVPKMYIDYLAIQRVLQVLSPKGRAIIVVPNSTLFRGGVDQFVREKLISMDMIEAVITLPKRMYDNTMAQVNLLILSKLKVKESRRNKIQFIDASQSYIKSNSKYIMTEEHINNIVEVYKNEIKDDRKSLILNINELEEYDYSLYIWNKYRNKMHQAENERMLKLKDVAEIIRGIQISKEKYEQAKEKGSTHYYVTAGDIDAESANIKVKEESLIKPEERWIEKCELQEDDLILTMKGPSFKIGIVHDLPKSIISGNLMIIRSVGKYNPYVLKQYLESPYGRKIISSIQRGTSISIINPEDLGEISIPKLTIEEQESIKNDILNSEEEYVKSLKEITEKRRKEKSIIYRKMHLGGIK